MSESFPGPIQPPEDYGKLDEAGHVRALAEPLDVIYGRVFATGDSEEDANFLGPKGPDQYVSPMIKASEWIAGAKTYKDILAAIRAFQNVTTGASSPKYKNDLTLKHDSNRAIFGDVLELLTAILDAAGRSPNLIPPVIVALHELLPYFRDTDIGELHHPEKEAARAREGLMKLETMLYAISTNAALSNKSR